jgi:hypothetical protein
MRLDEVENNSTTICAWCKKKHKVNGKWVPWNGEHEGPVSHGICDDCETEVNKKIDAMKQKQNESRDDVQIISTHREYPDAPLDVKLRIGKSHYLYKEVGYDDLEYLKWELKIGKGFKALNNFKKKGYEYEKLD